MEAKQLKRKRLKEGHRRRETRRGRRAELPAAVEVLAAAPY
jgi:hypothetical protein